MICHQNPTAAAVFAAMWLLVYLPGVREHRLMAEEIPTNSNSKLNRLANEKSPYLLQHKANPVDWYPWGDEAFEKAKRENKPIFLSVGYSTCHWCHVMEHESFEQEEVAAILNEHFVSIKLDREERPDIDRIYMQYLQMTTGGGGWPMSVFLTPEKHPFVAGTYYPKDQFMQMLTRIHETWQEKSNDIRRNSLQTAIRFKSVLEEGPATEQRKVVAEVTNAAFTQLHNRFDRTHAGFGEGQKFPTPVNLDFLLQYADGLTGLSKNDGQARQAQEMVFRTLDAMMNGGIFDHVGGGFHRYTVDRTWHVPHFEKMLYDQAQLAITYLHAYQITGRTDYAQTARRVFEYVERDLSHPRGAFYSAEDADSAKAGHDHKVEGAFYVWSLANLRELLSADEVAVMTDVYRLSETGNAPAGTDPFGEFTNQNILKRFQSNQQVATSQSRTVEEVAQLLGAAHQKLFAARAKRPRPHLDDKILTSWNGLMISAYAVAAQALGDASFAERGGQAAAFILENLRDGEGRLLRSYRDGASEILGFSEDYAALIGALIDLYQTTGDGHWLRSAVQLQDKQITLLFDTEGGGFADSTAAADELIVQMKSAYDGAEPSPNSMSAMNLVRLGNLFKRDDYLAKAALTFERFAPELNQMASGHCKLLSAYDCHTRQPAQIVLAGDSSSTGHAELIQAIHSRYLPLAVLVRADGSETHQWLGATNEVVPNMRPLGGAATLYLCRDFTCQQPTSELAKIEQMLDEL